MSNEIEKKCIIKGVRLTDQRKLIAKVMSESKDHPDVDELHKRVNKLDNKISIATVYRTVRLFEDVNLIQRHDFGDGRSRYELSSQKHHDHLIDLESGEVIEFTNDEIERLQTKIAKEYGYKLTGHRLDLFGVRIDQDEGSEGDG